MRMKKLPVAAFSFVLFACALQALALADWAVVNTFHIGGEGGWDYVTVDPQTHRLYVTRSTHTMVIDGTSGQIIADLPGQKRSHGVAIDPEAGRGFVSDGGGDGAIVIFDLKTNVILGSVVTVPDTDGIIYDKGTGLVLAVSGDKGVLMTLKPDVDPKSATLETPIELGGAPEFLAADGHGKVYVNLMNKDEVAVVDIAARKVIALWPVAPGGSPVGMSMDVKNHRIFIGCRKPTKLIVMSTDDGKVISDVPIGAGVDATKFDQGQAFASCRDGSLVVAGETSPGKFEAVQTVSTPLGARTMGLDPTTHTLYLPTAELVPPPAGSTARPTMKPDSFMIVVVGRPAAQ
jgi:DNA-binding beta-propeller fold protein YncE